MSLVMHRAQVTVRGNSARAAVSTASRAQFSQIVCGARVRDARAQACPNQHSKWRILKRIYTSVCCFLQYFYQSQVRPFITVIIQTGVS